MASSYTTTPSQPSANSVNYLKYIVETLNNKDETKAVFDVARELFTNLTHITVITDADVETAAQYAKAIIASQVSMLLTLKSRVLDLPEHFAKRSNDEIREINAEGDSQVWINETTPEGNEGLEEPFKGANRLVEMIVEKAGRDDEIEILQDELKHRLMQASSTGWITGELSVPQDDGTG